MTNAQINAKLEKLQNFIDNLREEVENEIQAIEEKKDAIEEKAYDRPSGEMTEKEEERFNELDERQDNLQYLIDYCLSIDIEDNYLYE